METIGTKPKRHILYASTRHVGTNEISGNKFQIRFKFISWAARVCIVAYLYIVLSIEPVEIRTLTVHINTCTR